MIIIIQNVQIFNHFFVAEGIPRKGNNAIKNGKGIAQSSIGFHGNHMQPFFCRLDVFLHGNFHQMPGNVIYSNAAEIENLTARKNGWKNFVFFSGGQNKNSMRRGLFQGF